MARTGMSTLISNLRDLGVAGTGDYTLGTTNYWSDNQLQTILDRHKLNVLHEELVSVATYNTGGTLQYKDFYSAFGNYEETSAGTAIFVVEDGTGNAIGTSLWSMDYATGKLTFTADQGGSVRYITGQSYDLYSAAADVWRQKAGHHAAGVDFSTDNMTVKRGQLQKNDLEMANYYAGMGRVKHMSFERDDTA
jgi:hypothetical protein